MRLFTIILLLASRRAAATTTVLVSGGENIGPNYYNFDSALTFVAGETYAFVADGISAQHPFAVGGSTWGSALPFAHDTDLTRPLVGTGGEIVFTIPPGFAGGCDVGG